MPKATPYHVSVVVPLYNEEESLPELLERTQEHFAKNYGDDTVRFEEHLKLLAFMQSQEAQIKTLLCASKGRLETTKQTLSPP